jgi:hypothetical protein
MAIYEINASTTISVPPHQVWAVLDDFSGWPTWMPAMQNLRIEHLSDGPPGLGYRFRLCGKITHAELEVTGYGPLERSTRFRLNLPPLSGENHCHLKPLEDGRYRIIRSDRLNLPGPVVSFLDKTQRERFERLAAEFLLALKHTSEQGVPHASTPSPSAE